MRVGLVLLALVTLASIAGTLIAPLERAQEIVYYNWWYLGLLLLLATNISCVTIRSLLTRVLPSRRPRFMRDPESYKTSATGSAIAFEGRISEAAEAFRRRGFRVHVDREYGFAVRGWINRWGATVAHLGIVVVLLAGFSSKWFAEEGRVRLVEGGQTDRMFQTHPARGEVELGFTLRCDDFETAVYPKTNIPSKYVSTVSVKEAGKSVITAPVEVNRSLTVQGWTLHQTSFEELPGGKRLRLALSHPQTLPTTVTLELTPGQARPIPELKGAQALLHEGSQMHWAIADADGSLGHSLLEGMTPPSLRLIAQQFEPDFVIGENKQVSSRSQEMKNPALHVILREGSKVVFNHWLFGREDLKGMGHDKESHYQVDLAGVEGQGDDRRFHVIVKHKGAEQALGEFDLALGKEETVQSGENLAPSEPEPMDSGGWIVRLDGTEPLYATILSLTRNPMIPIIYVGCSLMMAGLLLAFVTRRREIFFWLDEKERMLRIVGVYSQPSDGLDRATKAVLSHLEKVEKS